MDIHKPKPIHNWREFLKEVGTIVLGILIALGLEQAVEALHERQLARESEAAIHEEMAENVRRVEYRLGNQACDLKRLDEISALLAGWAIGKEFPAGLHVGLPGDLILNDQRWQANLNSGRFSRESADSQAQQTGFYTLLHAVDLQLREELVTWDQLRALEQGSQFLTPAYRPKLVEALVAARAEADTIAPLGGEILRRARAQNLPVNTAYRPVAGGTTCQPMAGGK